MASYLAGQSVAGVGVFPRHFWYKESFIPTCVKSRLLPVNKARWRNHMTCRLCRNRSSSSQVVLTLDVIVTTIIDASTVASMTHLHCVPGRSVEIGYLKRWTKLWSRSRRERRQRPWRGRTTRWMTPLSCTRPRMDCRPHPWKREMTGRPGCSRTRREKTRQPPRPRRLSCPDFMIKSPGRLSHPVCLK